MNDKTFMYGLVKDQFERKMKQGADGKDLVDGAIRAIKEFVNEMTDDPKELKRIADYFTSIN